MMNNLKKVKQFYFVLFTKKKRLFIFFLLEKKKISVEISTEEREFIGRNTSGGGEKYAQMWG